MATVPIQKPQIAQTISGGPPLIKHFPEAASQTFKKGDWLKLSSGQVVPAADDETAAGTLLGIADQDATGSTNAAVRVAVADGNTMFSMNIKTGTLTSADLGKVCAIDLTSTNWTIDVADVTGGGLVIMGPDPRDACANYNGVTTGDTTGRYLVMVTPAKRALAI